MTSLSPPMKSSLQMADVIRDLCLAGNAAAIAGIAASNPDSLWHPDEDGRHALHWACTSSTGIKGGVNASPGDARGEAGSDSGIISTLLSLPSASEHINDGDEAKWTPLMIAVSGGKMEAVRALLEAGASADCRTETGQIALHYHKVRCFPVDGEGTLSRIFKLKCIRAHGPFAGPSCGD